MATEKPQIPDLAERRPRRKFGYRIGGVVGRVRLVLERCDAQIDLAHLKAGELEAEIEAEQREVLELLRQQLVVPGGDLGQPVVGDHEGAGLRGGQVIEAEGRHLGNAELAAGEQPAVPGDHVAVAIDQDRHVEAESLDAVGDLPDLLLAVPARVGRIRLQIFDPTINNPQINSRCRPIFSTSQT